MAQAVELPEDPRAEEPVPGAERAATVEVSEAVTPARRFYANPADL